VKLKYIPDDGKYEFDTAEDCLAYEAKISLSNYLPADVIDRAMSGEDKALADALEDLGNRISKARRERGDLKKRGRQKDSVAPEAEAPAPT